MPAVVSGRYFRVDIHEAYYNTGWFLACLTEFEIFKDGVNVALGKTVTASGSYNNNNPPAAIDGTKGADIGWVAQNEQAVLTTPSNVWWKIDMGSIMEIDSMKLYTPVGGSGYASIKSYKVYASDNNSIWTLINDTSGKAEGTRTDSLVLVSNMTDLTLTLNSSNNVFIPKNTNHDVLYSIVAPGHRNLVLTKAMTDNGALGSGRLYSSPIDRTKWVDITATEVLP